MPRPYRAGTVTHSGPRSNESPGLALTAAAAAPPAGGHLAGRALRSTDLVPARRVTILHDAVGKCDLAAEAPFKPHRTPLCAVAPRRGTPLCAVTGRQALGPPAESCRARSCDRTAYGDGRLPSSFRCAPASAHRHGR